MIYTRGKRTIGTQAGQTQHGIYTLFFFFVLYNLGAIDRSRNDMTGQNMCSIIIAYLIEYSKLKARVHIRAPLMTDQDCMQTLTFRGQDTDVRPNMPLDPA